MRTIALRTLMLLTSAFLVLSFTGADRLLLQWAADGRSVQADGIPGDPGDLPREKGSDEKGKEKEDDAKLFSFASCITFDASGTSTVRLENWLTLKGVEREILRPPTA